MPTRPLAARSYTAAMMRTCSLILAVSMLAACGQKGPLYRADETPQEVPAPGTSTDQNQKKKTPVLPPAPQSQKVPQSPQAPPETSTPTDPAPAPPAVDPDRPATPPPGN